ncbi:MAG: FkbM family methyltransferase [Candidatus Micrarchaeaceae archaeon]|nr:FkbM family methyltransferase [Candidatus Micrarchaeota archaeon]HII09596.1 FkbM family methyltransferase [Candidatus Micrarchaeota archaeon]
MALTEFLFKHSKVYSVARMSGVYSVYLKLSSATKPKNDDIYDKETTAYIKNTLKAGDALIDCGANVGYFSILASDLQAQVYSFEPVKSTFKILESNLEKKPNVKLINKAVGNKNGSAYINVSDDSGTNSMINYKKNVKKEEILVTTLDSEFPDGVRNLKIIKFDVEGMEKEAIEGGTALIRRHMPNIIFEFNYYIIYSKNRNYNEIFDLLKSIGYNKFVELSTGKEVNSYRDLTVINGNVLSTHV